MPRASRPWFRFYVEGIHDRKLRSRPTSDRWLWVVILAIARQSNMPGYLLIGDDPVTVEDLVDLAAIPARAIKTGLTYFTEKRMLEHLDGKEHVTMWNERQFESDDVAARTAKHRSNVDVRNVPTPFLVTTNSVSVSEVVTSNKNSDENFNQFYAAYPLHVGKQAARKKFDQALANGIELETIVAGAERYRDDPSRDASFTKHPATWLNHGCWDDDPLPSKNPEAPKPAAKPKDKNLERAQLLGELAHLEKINDTGAYRAEIDEINARLAELEGDSK